jgi:hypothetical protein
MGEGVAIVVVWIICGFIGAAITNRKGRGAGIGIALGLLLGLIGLVICLVLSDQKQVAPPLSPADYRECPHCKEPIRRDASVCSHCRRGVDRWSWHQGHWWSNDAQGHWFWLDEKANEWHAAENGPGAATTAIAGKES